MRCIDCESHAIITGKLDCNHMNRLGLAQPKVKDFFDGSDDPVRLAAQVEAAQAAADKKKKELAELVKIKETYLGGGKDGKD